MSYAHKGIERDTLEYLVQVLRDALGPDSVLYDRDLNPGERISVFMDRTRTVDAVILILTPEYKKGILDRSGGVYTEFRAIWNRYQGEGEPSPEPSATDPTNGRFEIIPLLFSGSSSDAVPEELQDLLYEDLTSLRVQRKPTGEFVIPPRIQAIVASKVSRIAKKLRVLASLSSSNFDHLSKEYYDRLFVDLKARFDDPAFAAHDYVKTIVVKTHAYKRLNDQAAYFVVGRKGSGKSTLVQALSLLNPDRYYGPVNIVVDDFNLESLYALYSDQQFRSDVRAVVSRDRAFEFTWEAVLMLGVMEALDRLDSEDAPTPAQSSLLVPLKEFLRALPGSNPAEPGRRDWTTTDYFNYAFKTMMTFVKHCIDSARADDRMFLVDIGARFKLEHYLNFVFPRGCLGAFRSCIRAIDKKLLVTLDGFDTAYDQFRLDAIRMGSAEDLTSRAHFEIDWLRSLLRLVVAGKSASTNYLFRMLDFCIAVPKDRYLEIQRIERDSYRNWHRGVPLNWSGIELAILLRKRLEVLTGKKTHKNTPQKEIGGSIKCGSP